MRLIVSVTPTTMTRIMAVLAIAALSLHGQPGDTNSDPLPASIRGVKVRVMGPSSATSVICWVGFEATVRNDRQAEIRIGSEPVYSARADLRIDTGKLAGEWTMNFRASWYDIGQVKYDQCSVVPPGGTYELPKVGADIVLTKTDGHLPSSATARFHLVAQCMDGKTIHSESILTEPVHIDVPAIPEK